MTHDHRIIYVDPEPPTETITVLTELGVNVDHVETASECFEALPDEISTEADDPLVVNAVDVPCVVTEYDLPRTDGITLCRRIDKSYPAVPIALYTDDGNETLAGEAIAAGADAYVPKSQGVETLTTRLVELLVNTSEKRVRRQTGDRLETLQKTSHELLQADSRTAICESVIDATEAVIDDSLAGIRLYDDETDRLEIVATSSQLAVQSGDLTTISRGDGLLWDIYEEGSPRVIEDASGEMVPYDLEATVENAIFHPLGEHGLLTVAGANGTDLTLDDFNLIHVLAATAESALDRAVRDRELERAKTVIEAVGDSVYALDADGRFVTINDRLTEITGYEKSELLGEHVSKAFDGGVIERAGSATARSGTDDEKPIRTVEMTVVSRDGTEIPCEVNTTVLRSNGEVMGSVGVVRDVSDRIEIEDKLRDQRAKMERLHEVASNLEECTCQEQIFELALDAAKAVLEFDTCAVFVVEDDVFVKKANSDTVPGAVVENTLRVDEGLAGKTYQNKETYRLDDVQTDPDAKTSGHDIRSALSVPVGDHGVFQALASERRVFEEGDEELAELLLSHVADALDRIAFEERLKAERDRFVALFENVPDAVVSSQFDADQGPIVDRVNPAFERVFGYEQEEVVEQPLDRFIVPPAEEAAAESINRRGQRGEIVETEVKRQTTDGLRDFRMRLVPQRTGDETSSAFGVYTDITKQKQRQKRVEILNRVLRHDLRNGMNIINGCAEMLAEAVDDDGSRTYAETIQERSADLISLAEKTRAVERTLDRGDAATGPVDVIDGIETAVEGIEGTYTDAEITCSLSEAAYARADDLLEEAVFHVLENAVQHNDMPVPTVEVSVAEGGPDDDVLAITVADNGPGIPDAERELLEEDKEITQLRHASGLGLWLVNWVVTQSGGQLRFEENEPRGTVVVLEVPKADLPSTGVASEGAAAAE